jgi:hypothetical protein
MSQVASDAAGRLRQAPRTSGAAPDRTERLYEMSIGPAGGICRPMGAITGGECDPAAAPFRSIPGHLGSERME